MSLIDGCLMSVVSGIMLGVVIEMNVCGCMVLSGCMRVVNDWMESGRVAGGCMAGYCIVGGCGVVGGHIVECCCMAVDS